MRVLIDMNLSPDWIAVLEANGHEAKHWMSIGPPTATDQSIMEWARKNRFHVLTHDLDFSAVLAATGRDGPSVLQVRSRDVMTDSMGPYVLAALTQFAAELEQGAIVVVEPGRAKARILPLR